MEPSVLVEWRLSEFPPLISMSKITYRFPQAMIVMGLILCLSVFPFRKKAYEFFIFCHILGVIMFLAFLYL